MVGKEIAKPSSAGALATTPDDEFAEYAKLGFENVTAKDILIPRISILQALSPQLNKKKSEYVAGAEISDICDVGAGQIFKEGILFLPILYRVDYLEWAPRDSGKGLVAVHTDPAILDLCDQDDKGRYYRNGNLIDPTGQFYGFNLSADARPSYIPFKGTQLKKSKKWLMLATGEKVQGSNGEFFTPPFFYRSYKLTSGEESNNQGDWYGWIIERDKKLSELTNLPLPWRELKEAASAFIADIGSGKIRAALEDMAGDDAADDTSTEGAM